MCQVIITERNKAGREKVIARWKRKSICQKGSNYKTPGKDVTDTEKDRTKEVPIEK